MGWSALTSIVLKLWDIFTSRPKIKISTQGHSYLHVVGKSDKGRDILKLDLKFIISNTGEKPISINNGFLIGFSKGLPPNLPKLTSYLDDKFPVVVKPHHSKKITYVKQSEGIYDEIDEWMIRLVDENDKIIEKEIEILGPIRVV